MKYKPKYPQSSESFTISDAYHIVNGIRKYRKQESDKFLLKSIPFAIAIALGILFIVAR